MKKGHRWSCSLGSGFELNTQEVCKFVEDRFEHLMATLRNCWLGPQSKVQMPYCGA